MQSNLIILVLLINIQIQSLFCKYFTLIDYTSILLSAIQNAPEQRLIYVCPNLGNCYGITKLNVIKYKYYINEEDRIILSCQDEQDCYSFPSDDIRDVYTYYSNNYIYISWFDPSTNCLYNTLIYQQYHIIYLYRSFKVENVVKIQVGISNTGIYYQINSDGKSSELIKISYDQKQIFSLNLPENVIYWVVLDQRALIVVIFLQNEIQVVANNQITQTYKLEGNGITNPDNQIQYFNNQIIVKIYIPTTKQIRSIQINESGDIVQDIRIPNMSSDLDIDRFQAGAFNSFWYQQLNSTFLITVNQTYFASSLFMPNSVMIQNKGLTLLAYNKQYFEVFILENTNLDQSAQQRILNSITNFYSFQSKDQESSQNNLIYTNINQQYDSSQTQRVQYHKIVNFQNDEQFILQQSSDVSNQIQVIQQGIGLYYNPQDPCVIKDQNGNDILVKELEINIPSIFFSTYVSDQIYNLFFSAKVNGQWRVYQSSQRQLISFSDSSTNTITMIVLSLSTYFLVRGTTHFISAFYHRKEAKQIQDFILKQTQTKIPEKLFNKCYTVLTDKKLGEGAFGIVYQCKYTPSNEFSFINKFQQNQLFACKILTKTPHNMDSILQEVDALQSVKDCKSAIKMINYCITNEKVYIVLELAEQSLEDYLQKRYEQPFSNDEIIDIALDLIEVLVSLRNNNFNHRDIKPSNILIMPDKSIKLTDFGAAKRINLSDFTKKSDELIGSLPWMAPELLQAIEEDDENNLDQSLSRIDYEKCDIFSLGLTLLYVVLRMKLKGCNRFEKFLNNFFIILNNEYSYIQEDFRIMLRKMTSFDPTKRPTCFLIKQHLLEIQRMSFNRKYNDDLNDNQKINK